MQNKVLRILICLILFAFAIAMIYDTYKWYFGLSPAGDPEEYVEQMRALISHNDSLYTVYDDNNFLMFDIRPDSGSNEDNEVQYIFNLNKDQINELIISKVPDLSSTQKQELLDQFYSLMQDAKVTLTDVRKIINISNDVWRELTNEIYVNINKLRDILGPDDNYYHWPLTSAGGDPVFDIRLIDYYTSKSLTLYDYLLFEKDINIFQRMFGKSSYMEQDEVIALLENEILKVNPHIPESQIPAKATEFWNVVQSIRDQYKYIEIRKDLLEVKSNTISLGLDLAGGLHFELGIDEPTFRTQYYTDNSNFLDEENIRNSILEERGIDADTLRSGIYSQVMAENPGMSGDQIDAMVEEQYNTMMSDVNNEVQQNILYNKERIDANYETVLSEQRNDILELLRDRIDRFAISEVQIGPSQNNRIFVEIPGTEDKESTKRLLTQAGNLAFHLVAADFFSENVPVSVRHPNPRHAFIVKPYNNKEDLVRALSDLGITTPANLDWFKYVETNLATGLEEHVGWIPLIAEPEMAGDFIEDANVDYGSMGSMQAVGGLQIAFTLKSGYDVDFGHVTEDNVGQYLAIVLDGSVRSYPRINSAITGGSGVITGSFTQEEAEDVAKILKAAKLPASLIVLQEEVIGPSRGADNIESGKTAALVGFLVVILFMLIYYRIPGFIASIAVCINLFFTIAVLAQFDFTLSLPGIFGMVLTVGMSIDANVIINERIKEELRVGKVLYAAIDNGYSKAFSAIFDSNLTTIFSAMVLWAVGVGVVKGFGVTLLIGIVTSMISALFMTRLILDLIVDGFKLKKLWI